MAFFVEGLISTYGSWVPDMVVWAFVLFFRRDA